MPEQERLAPAWLLRYELAFMVLACAIGFSSIPLLLGHIGLSWDALNHHIYLGWTAEHPRFSQDHMAASYQGYLYPFLYWPAYKLAVGGASGVTAGVVLALLHVLAVPAVWKIAHACVPGQTWFAFGLRSIAMGMAFMSGVVLSMLDTTSNDFLASIPLVWAVAYALEPLSREQASGTQLRNATIASGLLAGVAVAFKLSNGPIAIVMPLLWLWPGSRWGDRVRRAVLGCVFVVAGFSLAYGYWGWQLWSHFGNPIHPFYDDVFEPLRSVLGRSP
jgi:hypothetical protein